MDNESLNWFRFAKCIVDPGTKVLRRYIYLYACTWRAFDYHHLWQKTFEDQSYVDFHSVQRMHLFRVLQEHDLKHLTCEENLRKLVSKSKPESWGSLNSFRQQLLDLKQMEIYLQDTVSQCAAQKDTLCYVLNKLLAHVTYDSLLLTIMVNWSNDFINQCHMNLLDLLHCIEQYNERTSSLLLTFLQKLNIIYIRHGSKYLTGAFEVCQHDERSSFGELKTNLDISFISCQSKIDKLIDSWKTQITNSNYRYLLQKLLQDMKAELPKVHSTYRENVNDIFSTWHENLLKMLEEWHHQLQQAGESTMDVHNLARKWQEELKAFPSVSDFQIKQFFDTKIPELKFHHILKETMWSLMFPSQGCVNLQALDLTMSFALLRTICPAYTPALGWGGEIMDTDHSMGADLMRLLNYRKKYVAYTAHLALPNSDFEKHWAILETILHRLSLPLGDSFWQEIQQKITELRTMTKTGNMSEVSLEVPKELTTVRIGQELLGKGRFGKVYKAYNDSSNITMAVKIVEHCGSSAEMEISGSIKREIEILKTLDHDHVIKYYGYLETETSIEIFLEYMPEGSVKDYMSKQGAPFSEHRTTELTRDVLEGIIYLHTNKILHRDLKGANVLLDSKMKAKLCDFGVSKKIETLTNSNTCCNSFVGSANWMSPEVVTGEKYGKKADIWSIGCTVVEMLTMHPPWHEFENQTVIFKIGTGMYPKYQLPQTTSTAAKDFLSQTFRQEAKERPKATELFKHSFIGADQPQMSD